MDTLVQNKSKVFRPGEQHNYVAFFLTFACNLKCPYCITLHDGGTKNRAGKPPMNADQWIAAADRLELRNDLPLTLQGGEPTLSKAFFRIINEVKPQIQCDLMTNLTFDVQEFIKNVPVWRFARQAKYAPIRVSYHPGQNKIDDLIANYFQLEQAGFRVGLYGILHPDPEIRDHILRTQEHCLKLGIDFRTKEFLGEWNGQLYGDYKYPGAILGRPYRSCQCRTTEIIVDPAGWIYRCHADLYQARNPYAHILDPDFDINAVDRFRHCDFYGNCNPCDVKIKTNRFQQFGHTSVEITDIDGDLS